MVLTTMLKKGCCTDRLPAYPSTRNCTALLGLPAVSRFTRHTFGGCAIPLAQRLVSSLPIQFLQHHLCMTPPIQYETRSKQRGKLLKHWQGGHCRDRRAYLTVFAAVPYTSASRASAQLCLCEHLAWTLQHHLLQTEVHNNSQCNFAYLRLCKQRFMVCQQFVLPSAWS